MSAFSKIVDEYSKNLELYVPVVARVHGQSHPEFLKVRSIYDDMVKR